LPDRGAPLGGRRALPVAVAAVVVLLAGFGVLLFGVLAGNGITAADAPLDRWLAAHREGWLTSAFRAVTALGSALVLGLLAVAVAAVAGWAVRSWRPVLVCAAGALGAEVLIWGIKGLVGRPRPPASIAVVHARGASFPSGHALGSAAVVLVAVWLLGRRARRPVGAGLLGAAVLFIAAVGFSRLYLGVHYLSDVLAGWLLGIAWAAIVVGADLWWRRAGGRQAPLDRIGEARQAEAVRRAGAG
jgi:undecaprenyl-diphosphatase